MTNVFRIVREDHKDSAFSGMGAKMFGGRWNVAGTAMVYTSGSLSLAVYEIMVHLDRSELADSYVSFRVQIPKVLTIENVDTRVLPPGWDSGFGCPESQRIGSDWAKAGKSAVLRVPAALIDGEYNFLLNPAHKLFGRIAINGPYSFKFDGRLMKP